MPTAKLIKNKTNSWVRLDALVTPAQYDLVVKISEIENISKAEATRTMIEIATFVIMGDLERANRRAASLPKPLHPEIFAEIAK